ncbi:MAG: TIGR02444 family protein [Gammaproteobacteria bacterium]|nr:TIGR02444 family protein [Gammaproteobacteria bacterium]
MKFPPSEFWNYSNSIYNHPEVENSCLKLQDKYQADINILLYCCWTGQKQISLSENDIKILINISQPWQTNILSHLRSARKTLKISTVVIQKELREQAHKNICEMELNAEHMNQLALEKAINLKKKSRNKKSDVIDCVTHNLNLYCQQLETVSSTEHIHAELNNIINTLFNNNTQTSQATG